MKKKLNIKLGVQNENRPLIFQIIVVAIFLLLVARLFYLQVARGDAYSERANKNRVKLKRVESPRGKIYDTNGRLLVTNKAGYRLLYLNERKYTEKELEEMSKLLGISKDSVEKKIKYGEIFPYTRENSIIDDLPEEEAHRIMEQLSDFPYLTVQPYSKRDYIYDSLASHVIGYVKKISAKEYETLKDMGYTQRDVVGKNGVEKQYDYDLQGKPGYDYIEVNALNRIVKKLNKKSPVPGQDMYLTIDSRLQERIERYFEEHKLQGSFIALNPKNGEILALVSYPTYSLNMFSSRFTSKQWSSIINDKRKPLTYRAIAGEYPPGSVFKPIISMGLLKNGLDPNEKYHDPGYYKIGKWKWLPWKVGGHGWVDFKKAITESANPYFYKLGDELGYKKLVEVSGNFGLGKKTGIDTPGEKAGRLPTAKWKKKNLGEPWYRGDTINMSIGQGYLTTTPIQIAQAYTLLANKGVAYRPHVVKELKGKGKDNLIQPEKTLEINYPKYYYNTITNAMINAVEAKDGTVKALRTDGLSIAAKSGSAQNSQFKKTHAWVAGYFPSKKPEIVFVAMAEGAGGGGHVAGRIAKAFVDEYLKEEKQGKEIKE